MVADVVKFVVVAAGATCSEEEDEGAVLAAMLRFVLLVNWAVRERVPALSCVAVVVYVAVATPFTTERVPVPKMVVPSLKVTVPVGIAVLPGVGRATTVAVKVTG